MSLIDSVKEFIEDYDQLATGALLLVDSIGTTPLQYAVLSAPGQRKVEQYLDGGSTCEFPFVFEVMTSTADDVARLEALEFFETFAEWLDTQTETGDLPILETGKTPEKIEAVNWAYLFDEGESQTGVYQIQCKLTYKQDAPSGA